MSADLLQGFFFGDLFVKPLKGHYQLVERESLLFQVARSPSKSSVDTIPKLFSEIWLIGSNATVATRFSVQVPEDQEPEDDGYGLSSSAAIASIR